MAIAGARPWLLQTNPAMGTKASITATGAAAAAAAMPIKSKHLPGSTCPLAAISSQLSFVAGGNLGLFTSWKQQPQLRPVTASNFAAEEEEQVPENETNSSGGSKGKLDYHRPGTRVYVGNLPFDCDSAELAGVVLNYGSAEIVEVMYDKVTGTCRGFGFVTMSTPKDADSLIQQLDGCEYGGRILRVNFPDKPRKDKVFYEVFVGNLSWGVNSTSLIKMFTSAEIKPVTARVVYEPQSGRSKGYGFVAYSSLAEAESSAQFFNGKDFEGRKIRVYVADSTRRLAKGNAGS